MLKLCDPSICKPLTLLFENCLASGEFPNLWKESNVVPVHKKGNKQLIKNYRPVPLLPICGKLVEKPMFNSIFSFIDQDSVPVTLVCINMLLMPILA